MGLCAKVSMNLTQTCTWRWGDSGLLSQVPVRIHQTASEMPPELVVQALLAYTSQNGYRSVIPAGTTLRSVRQEGTQYVVDLSAEFLSGERDTLYLAVRSVVATVLGLGDGTAVRITVEGATPAEDAGDWFSGKCGTILGSSYNGGREQAAPHAAWGTRRCLRHLEIYSEKGAIQKHKNTKKHLRSDVKSGMILQVRRSVRC